jgi:hypothetical protein
MTLFEVEARRNGESSNDLLRALTTAPAERFGYAARKEWTQILSCWTRTPHKIQPPSLVFATPFGCRMRKRSTRHGREWRGRRTLDLGEDDVPKFRCSCKDSLDNYCLGSIITLKV